MPGDGRRDGRKGESPRSHYSKRTLRREKEKRKRIKGGTPTISRFKEGRNQGGDCWESRDSAEEKRLGGGKRPGSIGSRFRDN